MPRTTKTIKPSKKSQVEVATNCEVVKENLPMPWVHYPDLYGTFFGFSETQDSQIFLCLCAKKAINNCISLKDEHHQSYGSETTKAKFSDKHFPKALSIASAKHKRYTPDFKPKLCHRCNITTPTRRYCVEMYGGNFKQFFGWYIKQTSFRLGTGDLTYIAGECPETITAIVDEINDLQQARFEFRSDGSVPTKEQIDKMRVIDKQTGKLSRSLNKIVEDITREEFGFRKVGEGNISESILANLVQQIYRGLTIKRNIRPDILEGLGIDIFLPEINLGIEYQGQQHFHPIKAWGGEKALIDVQQRDARKKELCKKNNIKLITIDYTEPLAVDYIKSKLDKAIGTT